MSNQEHVDLLTKLHAETALFHWHDLQRFFAQGKVLLIEPSLDLVSTGVIIASNDAAALKPLIDSARVVAPSNEQARQWYEDGVELWTVVVAPYVLVQERKA